MTSISNKKSKLHFLCKVGKRHSNLEFCLNNTNWKVFLVKAASVDASRSSYHHVILPCKSYFFGCSSHICFASSSVICSKTLKHCSSSVLTKCRSEILLQFYGKTTEHFKKCKPLPTNYYTKSNMLYSLKTAWDCQIKTEVLKCSP